MVTIGGKSEDGIDVELVVGLLRLLFLLLFGLVCVSSTLT